jgi:phosphonate dehydrogenase
MDKPTVVITHWVHDEVLQLLEEFCYVIPNTTHGTLAREEILKRSHSADGLMVFMPDRVDEEFLVQCPRLKVIGAALKGYDNFDVEACERRGIRFSIIPELLTEPTAELAVALLLGIGRNILPGNRQVRNGQFQGWRPVLYGKGLAGCTVGIVGMGAIGQAVAERLRGFSCQLLYSDPHPTKQGMHSSLSIPRLPLDELLAQSDFILLTVPLTQQTRHVINNATLAGMKTGAYLVNISRGSVVDESAVSAALISGQLAGYAADVFEFEDWACNDRPNDIHPALLANPGKTLFTPHLGSAVDSVRREIGLEAAHSILSVLNVTIV